jgi:hypothetical protein
MIFIIYYKNSPFFCNYLPKIKIHIFVIKKLEIMSIGKIMGKLRLNAGKTQQEIADL